MGPNIPSQFFQRVDLSLAALGRCGGIAISAVFSLTPETTLIVTVPWREGTSTTLDRVQQETSLLLAILGEFLSPPHREQHTTFYSRELFVRAVR